MTFSIALAAALSCGQCSGGCCGGRFLAPSYAPIQPYVVAAPVAPKWLWTDPNAEDESTLYQNGVQVGAYWNGMYRPHDYLTNTWGPSSPNVRVGGVLKAGIGQVAGTAPVKGKLALNHILPDEPVAATSEPNYGLDLAGMAQDQGKTTVNGKSVTAKQGKEAFGTAELVDDSAKKFVTVISADAAARDQVRKDWESHPALAEARKRYHFQTYAADDPMVSPDLGFVTTGSPTIYFQDPTGKDLFRLSAYPGPEKLAEYVRTKDPTYEPVKDPDPSKPVVLPKVLEDLPGWVWALLAAGGVYTVSKKKST